MGKSVGKKAYVTCVISADDSAGGDTQEHRGKGRELLLGLVLAACHGE